ncbi:beta strand repeat-containing protein, partial [Lonepinella koalarum]
MNHIYKVIWSQVANAFIAVSELASSRGKTNSIKKATPVSSITDRTTQLGLPFKLATLTVLFMSPFSAIADDVNADNLTVSGTSTFTGTATFNGGITTNSLTINGSDISTQISTLETDISNKADQTTVDTLSTTVDSKADQTTVDALTTMVDSKADQTTVDALTTTVNTKADQTTVDALTTTVDSKADQTTVDALTTTVNTKADQTTVDALTTTVNSKADQTTVDALTTTVNSKADQTTVDTLTATVATKASQTDLNNLTTNVTNLNTTVTNLNNTKADKTELNELNTTVIANKALFDNLNTSFNTLNTSVDTLGLTTIYSGIKYFRVNSTADDAQATGMDALAAGPRAIAAGDQSVAVGNNALADQTNATAVGNNAIANQTSATAIGNNATATHTNATAMGYNAWATGNDAVAAGANTSARANDSVAVGESAKVENSAEQGIAIGSDSRVGTNPLGDIAYGGGSEVVIGDGKSSIAIGDNATGRGNNNIAMGKNALTSNNDETLVITSNSIAVGTSAQTIASDNAIAIGNHTTVAKNASSSLAIGDQAVVAENATKAVAVGYTAVASEENTVAIGSMSKASGANAVAVGSNSAASAANSVAVGVNSVASTASSIAIGDSAQATSKTISIGLQAGQGQPLDETGTKGSHINIGENSGQSVIGQSNIGIGFDAGSGVVGKNNVALGTSAGKNIANANETLGENIAIGSNANSYGSATAIQRATAVGSQTKAGNDAVAIGYLANASAKQSVAVGLNSQATGADGVAIGYSAMAEANSVALGANSVAKDKPGGGYLTGNTSHLVVSVGDSDANLLRRVVNVADGVDDQDAVTVAQLKQTSDEVYKKVNADINDLAITATSGINYDAITSPDVSSDASVTLKNDTGKGTAIHNVAAATAGTDAVNLAQVNQIVTDNKVHYFSVNDDGSQLGNYDNNKAIGSLSMAVGQGVAALGERSVAIGNDASAYGTGSIAMGTFYQGSVELDDGVPQSSQTNVNNKNQNYKYGLAVGAGANSEGNNSIAIGSLAASSTKTNEPVDRAIALGYRATSSANKANAIGDRATAAGVQSNAFGSEAYAGGASSNAIGTQASATGASSNAIGTSAQASGTNSIALGTNQRVTGESSGGIGYAGVIGGTGTYSLGNTNSVVSANASGIFGNSNLVSKSIENIRVVGNANEIGNVTTPTPSGEDPVNILKDIYVTGYGNTISSSEKLAADLSGLFIYGHHNTVAQIDDATSTTTTTEEDVAITDSSIIGANNTLNTAGSDYFILGNNVTATQQNSVYLGNASAYVAVSASTKGMESYDSITSDDGITYTFAGATPTGVVTVGSVGNERRIQNVAAGLVSSTSTDAINGSQLYTLTRPLRFGGDNSVITNPDSPAAGDANVISLSSNQAIDITGGGGDASKLTTKADKNIGVIVTDDNSMEVRLAKELTNLTSATFGTDSDKTVINKDGITITNSGKANVSLTDTGLDNGNNKIINVANGTVSSTSTDAVNGSQLYATNTIANAANNTANNANTTVNKGWNIKTSQSQGGNVSNNTTTNVKMGDTVTIDAGQNINITQNGQNISIATSMTPTFTSATFGGNTVINGSGLTITGGPNVTTAGIDAGNKKITNVSAGVADTDAVNMSQLNATISTASDNTYWNIQENGTQKDQVKNNDNVSFANGTGTTATVDLTGTTSTVKYSVNKSDLTVNSTTGKVDAPTVGDYFATAEQVAKAINDSEKTTSVNSTTDAITVTSTTSGQNTNYALDLSQVTKDSLKNADSALQSFTVGADNTGTNVTVNQTQAHFDIIGGNSNINTTVSGNQIKVNLNNTLDLSSGGSVTIGDTLLNSTGLTIKNGPSITKSGINAGNHTITNVANGTNGTDAVNLNQLNAVNATASAGWNLNTSGNATVANVAPNSTVTFNGDNNINVTHTGSTVNFTLASNLTATTITLKGEAGTNGTIGLDGANGTIGLTGKDGASANITVVNGTNGIDGTNITRIVYDNQTVATLNDGLKFAGNQGDTIAKKLGETLTIKGSLANESAATAENIRVDSESGNLVIKLAQNLTNLTSATFGTSDTDKTVINKDGVTITNGTNTVSLTETGLNNGGNNITNVANGTNGTDAVNLNQLNAVNATASAGWNLNTSGNATVANVAPNSTVTFNGDNNINVTHTGSTVNFTLASNLTATTITLKGEAGTNGTIGLDGANGTIGLTGKDGASANITVVNGTNGIDGTNITRIVYDNQTVATLNDGLFFTGDDTNVTVGKKLNETLTIKGNLSQSANVTDQNLRVDVVDKALVIKMAKDLTDLNSATFGTSDTDKTVINKDGVTITNGTNTVSLTETGLNNGDNKITNVSAGIADTDAVNMNQLNAVNTTANAGWTLTDGTNTSTVKPNATVALTNTDGNINIINNNGSVTFDLANELDLGANGSVTIGNTSVNNDGLTVGNTSVSNNGLTIVGGPSVTKNGIDAANTKVTGVAAGDISATSTDAING